ncbi:MAG TPA: ATP-dependent Clp protease ATP-binding subunit ClpA [Vicinamibacterales bacterium]|nr:ATP-dependent Clp protease ATP-binding subunit ClpA [Vicinamibacterales bacterium]
MFSASIEIVLTIAYREAVSRRHAYLTLEHLLYALAHDSEGERILKGSGADLVRLRRELNQYLESSVEELRRGQEREPEQTAAFRRVLQTAVLHVQSAQRAEVNAGDVLAAILQQPKAYAARLLEAQGITRLDILDFISHGVSKVTGPADETNRDEAPAGVGDEGTAASRDPLAAYCLNLTDRARRGLLDPLIGRADELQRTIEILSRRRKNNPVFVGEAGVGKTAMAEGLATRLLAEDVPEQLQGAEVYALDTGALLAGTRFRGDFEERFKAVIKSLSQRPHAILFIDEIHSTVGAGATTGGTMDLATLIKPILTAGELRVIGSTTFEEFKHIEKDRALARRLQKIAIEEPSIEETVRILSGLRARYEDHHGVKFSNAALETAARLAARHLRDYKLPDSAIDVIDEAGAVTKLRAAAQKAAAEEKAQGEEKAEGQRPKAEGKGRQDGDFASGATAPRAPKERPGEESESASAAARASGGGAPRAVRNEDTLVVDSPEIEAVVARMARIPARQASSSDRERLRTLQESLERVVFGQPEAVHLVAQSIKRSRAGLGVPERPAGSFLFTGPTGVGKTELAKQLAIQLGNEFIRFDMSEYMEKHAVARLIGAPPGYVGFEQGGQLVDAVRTHPYSVVLLDEIEKAHPDIYNILLQVMDHATLTDNSGRKADFRNVVLILTSNAGSREMSAKTIGFAEGATDQERDEARRRIAAGKSMAAIERVFSPEFRNRLDAIVTFKNLTPQVMETIVEKFVLQLEAQLAERHVAITLTPEARAWLAVKGYDAIYGARPLARVVQKEVRDPLTDEILFGKLEQGGTVTIGEEDGRLTFSYEGRETKAASQEKAEM